MNLDAIIVDADICIKIGRFDSLPLIELILPKITEKAYIHRYVLENEILIPKSAKQQIQYLIDRGELEVLDEESLNPLDKKVFEETTAILQWAMIGTEKEGKNWGEVLSLAMAKTLGIPIFLTDEGNLQSIINKYLNTETEFDIRVFRIQDLIYWIKDHPHIGISRKTAKALWLSAGKNKEIFNNQIWRM